MPMDSTNMDFPEINNHRPIDDPEYTTIRCVEYIEFFEYMKDRDLHNLRLPLNNPDAYQYLRWLNEHFIDDNNYLNYLLNIWDARFSVKPVRPPTAREIAIFNARHIVKIADAKDGAIYIDSDAELIRDAYRYDCYPIWMASGLAGCVMKWGTFEDNAKPGDDYITWEEWNS